MEKELDAEIRQAEEQKTTFGLTGLGGYLDEVEKEVQKGPMKTVKEADVVQPGTKLRDLLK